MPDRPDCLGVVQEQGKADGRIARQNYGIINVLEIDNIQCDMHEEG